VLSYDLRTSRRAGLGLFLGRDFLARGVDLERHLLAGGPPDDAGDPPQPHPLVGISDTSSICIQVSW
jgi:hypothetical protein